MKKVISFLLLSILLITITPVITQAEDVTEQNQSPMIEEFSIPVYEDINSLIDSPKKAAVVKKVADIKFWVTPNTKTNTMDCYYEARIFIRFVYSNYSCYRSD